MPRVSFELGAVVDVVAEDALDDGAAGKDPALAIVIATDVLIEHVQGPSIETALDDGGSTGVVRAGLAEWGMVPARHIAGLVSGSIAALGAAFGAIVGTLQGWLPGPLFPIALVGVGMLVYWGLFRR